MPIHQVLYEVYACFPASADQILVQGSERQTAGTGKIKISGVVGGQAVLAAEKLDPAEYGLSLYFMQHNRESL
ncbi:MAG: hypothetical protein WB660_09495 [Candidatus Sulfotelmatobacter sp.]